MTVGLTIIDELLEEERRKRSRRRGVPFIGRTLRDIMEEDRNSGYDGEPRLFEGGQRPWPSEEGRSGPSVAPPRSEPIPADVKGHVTARIMSGEPIMVPSVDPSAFRLPGCFVRELLEGLLEDPEILSMLSVRERIDEIEFVRLHPLVRPGNDERAGIPSGSIVRGMEPLCELLSNGRVEMDPTENEWRYLDIVLGLFSAPCTEGRIRRWVLRVSGKDHTVECEASPSVLEYVHLP